MMPTQIEPAIIVAAIRNAEINTLRRHTVAMRLTSTSDVKVASINTQAGVLWIPLSAGWPFSKLRIGEHLFRPIDIPDCIEALTTLVRIADHRPCRLDKSEDELDNLGLTGLY